MAGESAEKSAAKTLAAFMAVHFSVWFAVSMLRGNPHPDALESLAWARDFEWGSNKHPPLSAWALEVVFRAVGDPGAASYLLSQACVAAGFIFTYKLARRYLEPGQAVLSVLFLEGSACFTFYAPQYNNHVLSLALLPVLAHVFRLAVESGALRRWIAVGVAGGLCMLNKYPNAFFIMGLGLYLPLTEKGRRELKRPGLYLAFLVALLMVLPHALWMRRYGESILRYTLVHTAPIDAGPAERYVLEPAALAVSLAGMCAGSLLLFLYAYLASDPASRRFRRGVDPFLLLVGAFPAALHAAVAVAGGMNIVAKWFIPFLTFVPLLLFAFFPVALSERARRNAIRLTYAVMVVFAAAYLVKILGRPSVSTNIDGRGLAAAMKGLWDKRFDRPLRYVAGDMRIASNVAAYLPERPRVRTNGDAMPWIDAADVIRSGAMVFAASEEEYAGFRAGHPSVTAPLPYEYVAQSAFGGEIRRTMYYGFLAPDGG